MSDQRIKLAQLLCKQAAEACGTDYDDNWKFYSEDFTKEADEILAFFGQSQAIPQWIACSERMPVANSGEQILVACFGGYVTSASCWVDDDTGIIFEQWDGTRKADGDERIADATHWMPLPAAPSPQGENHE